ncbi:hypothetical protein C2869_15940 [Saccharobesus litoralis]|uniref:diguanylate cyclase n=1 Tax=Saccharobesus litoralis TaxID=2172099 RepID=A0A2S0VUD0_9ALTE|nr:GGDEF domain-containing protein [Saccharobesus litoralis]AWB67826.1 hypothetical protein C2869_15940 [Saccharobesus litoralis]
MTRKTLGLFISELTRNNNYRLFSALKQQAQQHRMHLIAFEGRCMQSENYADKQLNFIYQFCNEELIDDLIVPSSAVPLSFTQSKFERFFKNTAKSKVITYYTKREGYHSVRVDNASGSSQLVEHLLAHHQYQRFIVIRGPVNDDDANQRFKATIKVLESKSIEPLVLQGSWESKDSIRLIKTIIKQYDNYQAVIFPNDETAIAALDYINNFAPQYKEFFSIVGFDNSVNARNISPQLTTADHPHPDMAAKTFELITQDNNNPSDTIFESKAIIRASCGCQHHKEDTQPTRKLYTDSFYLHENLQALNHQDFFDKLTFALTDREISGCYINLYKTKAFELKATSEVPKFSKLVYAFSDGNLHNEYIDETFATQQLLPEGLWRTETAKTLLAKPLYYNNEHFGFIVFDVNQGRMQDIQEITTHVATTLHIINLFERMQSTLQENARLMADLAKINQSLLNDNSSLKAISTTDEMTGVLNRRGFYQEVEALISEQQGHSITFLYADMDRLKYVNDTFGHSAGDEAISKIASTLSQVFRNNDIVGRMGGDEFVICLARDKDFDVSILINRIDAELDYYNQTSGKPFEIAMSFGSYTLDISHELDIEKAIEQADAALYEKKKARKATR